MNPNFYTRGALRVEYRVQLKSLGQTSSLIADERRLAGGSGAVCAQVLAQLGARVHLSGNPIGDDSHGRFLLSQLQQVPDLELNIEVRPDIVTPYAILIRDENGATRTLLSPEAARLEGPQDYPALLDALEDSLIYWMGSLADSREIVRLKHDYDASFGDFASLRP